MDASELRRRAGRGHGWWAASLVVLAAGCTHGPTSAAPRASTAGLAHAATLEVGGGPRSGSVASAGGIPVPRIDAAMQARLRMTVERGRARGMRPGVFAKLGDSITESASFLQDIGHGWYELGPHADLAPTIEFFHRTAVDRDGNDSFAHGSLAAVSGWTTDDALEGSPASPVARELDALRPAFALVMFGTNDLDRTDASTFADRLGRIVDQCERRGVVAVLSTVPRRSDTPEAGARVPQFNAAIVALARRRALPVMDLHAALEPLPRHGLDGDGIHPSAFVDHGDVKAGVFTPEALRHGYNVRNLLAVRTLAKLRAVLLENGAPDR